MPDEVSREEKLKLLDAIKHNDFMAQYMDYERKVINAIRKDIEATGPDKAEERQEAVNKGAKWFYDQAAPPEGEVDTRIDEILENYESAEEAYQRGVKDTLQKQGPSVTREWVIKATQEIFTHPFMVDTMTEKLTEAGVEVRDREEVT